MVLAVRLRAGLDVNILEYERGIERRPMNQVYSVTMGERSIAPAKPMPAQAFDLFPTRIWQVPLKPLVPHFSEWVEAILAMRAALNALRA